MSAWHSIVWPELILSLLLLLPQIVNSQIGVPIGGIGLPPPPPPPQQAGPAVGPGAPSSVLFTGTGSNLYYGGLFE